MNTATLRKPSWLCKKKDLSATHAMKQQLRIHTLNTVCESASCPNISECFAAHTATFMIMGNVCTRGCLFCGVAKGVPEPLDPNEPARIAEMVQQLGLQYVVLTCVTRDDLPDGGAAHFAAVIRALHAQVPSANIEVLTSDFYSCDSKNLVHSLSAILDAGVAVFGHNIETARRVYNETRVIASYDRSLNVLAMVKKINPVQITKTALMLGLGETHDEILETLRDVHATGCDIIAMGQYLAPSKHHAPVKKWYTPDEFTQLEREACEIGFRAVAAGPFVRSSYRAGEVWEKCIMQNACAKESSEFLAR